MYPGVNCGSRPCGDFIPHRYYREKGSDKVPSGCIENAVFIVLGTTNHKSVQCPEFQIMHIDYTGQQLWWKTGNGLSRCLENSECAAYYRELVQRSLSHYMITVFNANPNRFFSKGN